MNDLQRFPLPQFKDEDIIKFKEGDLVTSKWGYLKDIYLVMKTGSPPQDYYDLLNDDPKAIAQHTNRWTTKEHALSRLKNKDLAIRRIFNKKGQLVNSRTDHPASGDNYMLAEDYLIQKLNYWKDLFENFKKYQDDQKLFLLQGGHGDHRVRRNHVQARKGKVTGAAAV